MAEPELVLLDEPTAGLDLGGREDLLLRLTGLARDPTTPPLVLVTHHVDEIPDGFTHALVLADGGVVAQGPLADVLTGRRPRAGVRAAPRDRATRWAAGPHGP